MAEDHQLAPGTDLLLSELFDDHSDACYAQGLQLQEVLMASLVISPNPEDVASPVAEACSPQQPEEAKYVIEEVGESSQNFCEICMERKDNDQMFTVESCKHSFCIDCIGKHVEIKVMDGDHVVKCPAADCKGVLELDSCTSVIPEDSLAKWNEAICRSQVPDSQKFYCPYENCSAMLLRDTDAMIMESECPECRRLFCAQCRVPWHPGIDCEGFQKLNEDERGREALIPRQLAKAKEWTRCPQCILL